MIVINQCKITSRNIVTKRDYWFLQFPFEIHFGWISAAFVLNLNIVAVDLNASSGTQLILAAVSLFILAFAALACIGLKTPQFTLPWVVVWATVSRAYTLYYLCQMKMTASDLI